MRELTRIRVAKYSFLQGVCSLSLIYDSELYALSYELICAVFKFHAGFLFYHHQIEKKQ